MNEEEIWITKDGTELKVKDMTTEHIKNTINAIKNNKIKFLINLGWFDDNDFEVIDENIQEKQKWLNIFELELQRRQVHE